MKPLGEKVMGVIGGMGPLATDLFYNMVIGKTDAKCDQDHMDMIILSHASMPDRTAAIISGDKEQVYNKLLKDAQFLENSGACCIAVPCNTSHVFLEDVQKEINIPIVHMIKEAVLDVKEKYKDIKDIKAGIMATDGTIETGMYQKFCLKNGVEPVIPSEENQKKVMKIIYEGVKKNEPVDPDDFKSVIDEFKEKGCDCVIMACTELSVYKIQQKLDDFYVDAMESLAKKAINICKG
jgi:aspartate racemase